MTDMNALRKRGGCRDTKPKLDYFFPSKPDCVRRHTIQTCLVVPISYQRILEMRPLLRRTARDCASDFRKQGRHKRAFPSTFRPSPQPSRKQGKKRNCKLLEPKRRTLHLHTVEWSSRRCVVRSWAPSCFLVQVQFFPFPLRPQNFLRLHLHFVLPEFFHSSPI
jgi:hypothetical protein